MSSPWRYDGKKVLVAGCYSGMGAATAQLVQELGARVVGFDVKQPDYDLASFYQVDLKDPRAIHKAVEDVAATGELDVLFYCAGLSPVHPDVDVLLVNFLGLRETTEACIPHLRRGGAIATISSGAGMGYLMAQAEVGEFLAIEDRDEACRWVEAKEGAPGFNAYAFSKMCTIIYTMQRGVSLPKEAGLRINCISPGPTATPMMPDFIETAGAAYMERYPRPLGGDSTAKEQAGIMAFLGSGMATALNGENIFSDGGTCGGVMTGAIDPAALMPAEG